MSAKKTGFTEILLWILAILLILVAVTPIGLGYKIKSDYSALVGKVADMLQLNMQIERYDQGLFSSDVVISIKIPNAEQGLRLQEQVIHGPFYLGLLAQGKSPLAAAVIKGQLDQQTAATPFMQKLFAGEKPLQYQNIVDFAGNVSSQAYVPPINTRFEDDQGSTNVQLAGAIINEYYSAGQGQLSGDAEMPVFKVQTDLYTINAESLNLSFSGSMGQNQILIGDTVASMGLMDIDSGLNQFAVKDLTLRSITTESGQLLNSGMQLSAREILASNQKFGPVKFNLSINGLNGPSLKKIQDLQKEVEKQVEQGMPAEQATAMLSGQMLGVVPELIKQAQIKINPLSVNSELGKLEADMDFALEGIDPNTPADPMFLLNAINLDVNMSIDEPLLKQIIGWQVQSALSQQSGEIMAEDELAQLVTNNIQGMITQNWLVDDGDQFTSTISMQQSELLINGAAVDPMQQIMSTMQP